jgi:hypothetical protein
MFISDLVSALSSEFLPLHVTKIELFIHVQSIIRHTKRFTEKEREEIQTLALNSKHLTQKQKKCIMNEYTKNWDTEISRDEDY